MSEPSLSDRLTLAGGPTVTDVGIRVDGPTLSVGGLTIAWPELVDYHDRGTNITVPPTWPTLRVVQLDHARATSAATFGVAVFKQTTLLDRADARGVLVDHAFRVARHQDSAAVSQEVVTDGTTGVTCWTEVRHGKRRAGLDASDRAVLLFAGPGLASSGVIVWGPPSFTGVPAIAEAIVASLSRSAPDDRA